VLAQAAVDIYYTKMGIAGIDASSIGEISGLATRTVQVYFVQVSQDKKNQSKTRTSDDR
jgi:hypothetical protein